MTFQDHFSGHASDYARARPRYPPALFGALAVLAPGRSLAWDAGTGNGQAAAGLAEHFTGVVATDPSAAQLAEAAPHPAIDYRSGRAESSGLRKGIVDLVTAAQAAHWFDLPGFYAEAARVLRPGGAIALWCYGLSRIAPPIDAMVDRFYHEVVGPYWPPERRHIENGYRDLPFPFQERPFPVLEMRCRWSLSEFMAYLGTWSAVQRFRERQGRDPLLALHPSLASEWGEPQLTRDVCWPLTGRAGTST